MEVKKQLLPQRNTCLHGQLVDDNLASHHVGYGHKTRQLPPSLLTQMTKKSIRAIWKRFQCFNVSRRLNFRTTLNLTNQKI